MNLLMFFIFRILFFLFFKYKFSSFLRAYSLAGFLILMILEGNVSFFAYLFVFDIGFFYSLDFNHELLNVLTLIAFFLYFTFLSSSSIIFFIQYKKLAEHLFNNVHPHFQGVQFLTFIVLKNALVGAINILLRKNF